MIIRSRLGRDWIATRSPSGRHLIAIPFAADFDPFSVAPGALPPSTLARRHGCADMCTERTHADASGPLADAAACKLLFHKPEDAMSLVRLLGFTTLGCGCVVGRYREVATSREVTYVEEKGKSCGSHTHRRNHTIATERVAVASPIGLAALTTKAS